MSGSKPSAQRLTDERPQQPWMPARLSVSGIYTRNARVRTRSGGNRKRHQEFKKRYDVRFRVDGHAFRYGFDRKGWAEDFARQLQVDFARGLLFDPEARRFVSVEGADDSDQRGPTFAEHARDYLASQWHRWEPATRRSAQGALALACLSLVQPEAPVLDGGQRMAADAYLRRAVFIVPPPATLLPEDVEWSAWFDKWSMPLDEVTDRHLRDFLDVYRSQALDGTARQAKPSTVERTRAVVRAAFTNARKRQLISWDPWDAVGGENLRDHDKVDPDLVMGPEEIRALARACGQIDPRSECYVLIMGLCGLRPGEATDLRRRDFVLAGDRPSVTVGGSRSEVPERYFTEGQTRRRPLKGRGAKARRTVPIPAELLPLLALHLSRYVDGQSNAYVFTTAKGARLNSSNFYRDVWGPSRKRVFEESSPLRKVRRQDLRHSAITMWLNAGVPLKTAQRWSGHKTLSVLLDTYLGVMKGDEDVARERFEEALQPPPEASCYVGLVTHR